MDLHTMIFAAFIKWLLFHAHSGSLTQASFTLTDLVLFVIIYRNNACCINIYTLEMLQEDKLVIKLHSTRNIVNIDNKQSLLLQEWYSLAIYICS